ncbi:MAG TPA: winged helix-turn-helix domain-containing protein, partial [Thermoanaerobaculia bacterium]|nr:winged helix-turn-helix domain-containing protein [Thermoanaerobaculia bacterium]
MPLPADPPDATSPSPAAGGREPLYRTIADAVIRDIRRSRYVEGERLPASRDLARSFEVNRATVHQALQVLKREGWIETNRGGGTRVAARSTAAPSLAPAPAWDRIASSLLARVLAERFATDAPPDGARDLSRLAPGERDFPAEAVAAL